MLLHPKADWLVDACEGIKQTPQTLARYLSDIAVPHVVGTAGEVKAAWEERRPICSRGMILGASMDQGWDVELVVISPEFLEANIIGIALKMNPDFLGIIVPEQGMNAEAHPVRKWGAEAPVT